MVKPHHMCECLIKCMHVETKTVTKECSQVIPLPPQVQKFPKIACSVLLLTSSVKERFFSAKRKPKLMFIIKC